MSTSIRTYGFQPEDDTPVEGKFVQLRWQGQDQLLFATREAHRFHNEIVAQFLTEQGAARAHADAEDTFTDVPGLEIVGGGRFRLDRSAGRLEVWDASSVYGRFDADRLPALLAAAGPPWSELTLEIR